LAFDLFVYQTSIEQAPSEPTGNTPFPFVWYKTPEDEFIDKCGQQQDERTALFSALTGDVNESESVDNKAEDEDVLCDLQSRHLNDVVSGMLFRDADTIVSVQQVDDAGMPNCRLTNQTLEQTCAFHATLSSSSFDAARGHIDTGTIPHACDVSHDIN